MNGKVTNTASGEVGQVIQAGDVYGDVFLTDSPGAADDPARRAPDDQDGADGAAGDGGPES